MELAIFLYISPCVKICRADWTSDCVIRISSFVGTDHHIQHFQVSNVVSLIIVRRMEITQLVE